MVRVRIWNDIEPKRFFHIRVRVRVRVKVRVRVRV